MEHISKEIAKRSGLIIDWELDLNGFYLFPQVRGENPDEIDVSDLLPSIASKGLFTPPLIAVFDDRGFEEYVKLTNALHKSSLSAKRYQPAEDGFYYVQIYGHRRVIACKKIALDAQALGKCETPNGKEFLKRLKKGRIKVKLIINPKAFFAKQLQLEENLHQQVEPQKEAAIVGELFNLFKIDNPNISIKDFRKHSSCTYSEEKIRDGLLFYQSPRLIREAVNGNIIKYGHAVQISRLLNETGFSEDKVVMLLAEIINNQPSVADFTKKISSKILEIKNPSCRQLDLSEMMDLPAETTRSKTKRQIDQAVDRDLERVTLHLRGISFLCQKGLLPLSDSPLLDESRAIKLKQVVELLEQSFGHIVNLVDILKDPVIPHSQKLTKMIESVNENIDMSKTIEKAKALAGKLVRSA